MNGTIKKPYMPPRPEWVMAEPIEPIKIFDDLYYFGNKAVGTYAIKTSGGLVLIDASDNVNAYDEYIIPGMEKMGLSGEKIRALFISHAHHDHYLGAQRIQEKTNCVVGMSYEDSAFMVYGADNHEGNNYKPYPIPMVNLLLEDGKDYTFGDHSIRVVFTPGHTPGCLSFTFDVHDNGEKHRAAVMGGWGVNRPYIYRNGIDTISVRQSFDDAVLFASTTLKLWTRCEEEGCDVYLNPHPYLCGLTPPPARKPGMPVRVSLYEKLKERKDGEPNPVVVRLEGVKAALSERFNAAMKTALSNSGLAE